MKLEGRIAVVTGAGSGIGRGLAKRFAGEGMNLVLAGLHLDALEAAASELAGLDVDTICVPTDVARLEDVETLARSAIDRFGQVHVLCNNAGVAIPGAVGEISMADWRWTLSVNLWGPIHGVQVFLPIMERQGVGHICLTASESGLYATAYLGAYNVSKFGVVGLMTSLARDLRARNSPVTASVMGVGVLSSPMRPGST